ncbi:MAG: ABC transporter ATP-binding protein [Ferrimicrobium sp.]
MVTVNLEQVEKSYTNGYQAVHALDLSVSEGEFMVLVGPSGCGKTTVLRMIAGLEEITGGVIRFGDRVVNNVPPRDRDIAMVFQNYALYPHMSVADNIGFALKLRKVSSEERERRVREAADILGLTTWLDRKPAQLSGGQRQRVAMGRAIVREPAVFLMDEPLSNLDAKLRVQMRAEVLRIQKRLGVATFYVTHDQTEAMTMGDRVAVLNNGVLLQCDVPQMLYDRPKNLFVAAFIGSPSMNLYEGRLDEGGTALSLGSQTLKLPERLLALHPGIARYAAKTVVVGLRPEHLTTPARPDQPYLEGDVDLIEALGSELLVHFSIDARRIVAEGVQEELVAGLSVSGEGVARVDPRADVSVGTRVRLGVDIEELHFFDTVSGDAIWE